MKDLKQYIFESKNYQDNYEDDWLDAVKEMYKWYCDNFRNFYDNNHQYDTSNYKKCDLIGGKKVKADCSGFVGACLCLAGYTNDAVKWNVRLGSFNHFKILNPDKINDFDKKFKSNILYITDIDSFECHRISEENKEDQNYSEIKAGDILVKGSHVTIAADDGAHYLYDWGEKISKQKSNVKSNEPLKFYIPKDKQITYPYRSYWRLKK